MTTQQTVTPAPVRQIFAVQAGGKDSLVRNNGVFLNETDGQGHTNNVGFTADIAAAQAWADGGPEPRDLIRPSCGH